MVELNATFVNALAICVFELVCMPLMDILSAWSAGLRTKLELDKNGECRLFECRLPIQAVPGFFSSRTLLIFFQLCKVAAVLALILFETFGDSKESSVYETKSGITLRRGFTEVGRYSETYTRQAEYLEKLCVRDGVLYETLISENGTFAPGCGERRIGSSLSVENNRFRGVPENIDTCVRVPFVQGDSLRNETVDITICDGKVNGIGAGVYLNFTDDVIEASEMTSEFDGYGYVTNILAVRLERRPISTNLTARAIRFYQNWQLLRSVRLALRAELVNINMGPIGELPNGTMPVESSTRTVYVRTPRATYCLYALAAVIAACLLVSISLWVVVLLRQLDFVNVSSLARVLQIAVGGTFERGTRVYLVAREKGGKSLHFERRTLKEDEESSDDELQQANY